MATKTTAKKKSATKAAKSNATAQANSIFKAFNVNLDDAQGLAKQAWFAGLGAVGKSVEEIQERFDSANEEIRSRYTKLNKDRQELVEDLVSRGEKVQGEASELLKGGQAKIKQNIESQIENVKGRVFGLASIIDIPSRLLNISDRLENLGNEMKKSA